MKRALSLLMVIMLVLGALAACGPNREEGSESKDNGEKKLTMRNKPEKLVVWEDEEKSGWLDEVGAKFEEETGIKVEVKEVEMATKDERTITFRWPCGNRS